jgi:L-amino acid N-acyltransferase YncA
MPTKMKFLIDTNIFIKAEPTSPEELEPLAEHVADVLREIGETGNQTYVHPASIEDINNDERPSRRELRKDLFRKYPILKNPPDYEKIMSDKVQAPRNSHDLVDYWLVAAVVGEAVDFLISEDAGVHKLARKVGMADRVVTIACAVDVVETLSAVIPVPPPAVKSLLAYELNENDVIFDSFRADYAGFDNWLAKCKREHRQAWIIRGNADWYAGVCIVKKASRDSLKICSFKVADRFRGNKFGELLLKTIFDYCFKNGIKEAYLTIFDKYDLLIQLLEDFGFARKGKRKDTDELVMVKNFAVSPGDFIIDDSLEFNIKLGPQALSLSGASCFLLPIYPDYHAMLFPEYEQQLSLIPGGTSCGNSIKKAYVCRSRVRKIQPGSVLLFYKILPFQEVSSVGVTESTLVTSKADEMLRFVAKRTVFSMRQIEELCSDRCLGILFRQAFEIGKPITLQELRRNASLRGSPQQIMKLPEGSKEWVKTRIGTQCF